MSYNVSACVNLLFVDVVKVSKMAWMAHSYVRNAKSFIRGLTWHRLASTDQAQSVKPFSDIPGEIILAVN